MIDGDFGRTGHMAHHIALLSNFSHHHVKWGFHSTDSHTVLIQDNLFAFCGQHSAYASDGSDNYVIRRNVFHGSRAGGLQCNLDPVASFREVLKHPAFHDFPAEQPTRTWALSLLGRATSLFGARNFPDGKGENFIIEGNVMWGNGKIGGGSLNLASLQDSLIQNNLIYANHNHGIAQWDNANPYDDAWVEPGPRALADVRGPADLPLWGCQNNRIRNNTVLMANPGRTALQARNGSWGGRYRNNIVVNDAATSIEVFNTSLFRLDSGYNVANTVQFTPAAPPLEQLAVALDATNHSLLGISRARVAGEFVRYGEEPWVLIEGHWWRLNPNRPDFRPRHGSRLLANTGDSSDLPLYDLLRTRRKAPDVGAFAAAD
jgi:hypothetical protein